MTIYDITLPITPELPVWPGDPQVVLEKIASMDNGDHDNISRLVCSVHTGTHVDAPHHFLNDHRTVERLDLYILTGPALVIQVPDETDEITKDTLIKEAIPENTNRLLIKTRNSKLWALKTKRFYKDFVGMSKEAAGWLVERGIKLVGIDYLSIAPYKRTIPTHTELLKPGIVILEGLDLSEVLPGRYELYCLPLKLVGSDGAPARAILIG